MPLCGSNSLLKSPSTLILPPKNACITACMSPWTNRERAVLYAIDTVTSGLARWPVSILRRPDDVSTWASSAAAEKGASATMRLTRTGAIALPPITPPPPLASASE